MIAKISTPPFSLSFFMETIIRIFKRGRQIYFSGISSVSNLKDKSFFNGFQIIIRILLIPDISERAQN